MIFVVKKNGGKSRRTSAKLRTHCEAMYKCALHDFCELSAFLHSHGQIAKFVRCGVWELAAKANENHTFGNAPYNENIKYFYYMAIGERDMTEREHQQLQKIREKMAQIKAQEKTIIAKDKKRQRKERTHRLIQIGAIAEKYLGHKDISPLEFEKIAKEISGKLRDGF